MDTNLRTRVMGTDISAGDRNPFGSTKCDEFSNEQIVRFWIEPGGVSAMRLLQPWRLMPMQVMGGKGSGKTHLLRYFSRPVQMMTVNSARGSIRAGGFFGVYVKCDSLNASRFMGKGKEEDTWISIFQYFLDLWLAQALLEHLPEVPQPVQGKICERTIDLFDEHPGASTARTLGDLRAVLRDLQRSVDVAVTNLPLGRELAVHIPIGPSQLTFGLPRIIQETVPEFANSVFLYLLDEVENLNESQQKYLNTLIRHRKGMCSFRIGSRLYGIKTHDTLEGETNRRDSEFDVLDLDEYWLRKKDKYVDFCERLCIRRLQESGHLERNVSHEAAREQLHAAFQGLPSEHFCEEYTKQLVSKHERLERPHLRTLRRNLLTHAVRDVRLGVLSEDDVQEMIIHLSQAKYPLLEKLNVFLLYKAWAKREDLCKEAVEIGRRCKAFVESGGRGPAKYASAYAHFSGDMLAQLVRENAHRVRYLGIETFIRMSSGLPRNLLTILKNTYQWAAFNGEDPFRGTPISIDAQEQAVVNSCSWFFEEALPNQDGEHVQRAMERLCTLFREIRYSDKPSECSLSTFSCRSDGIDESSSRVLRLAQDWSMLIKHVRGQKDRNSKRVDEKYQLSPMLAPRWGLSISRRGALALKPEEVNVIFGDAEDADFVRMKDKRVRPMNVPFRDSETPDQRSLQLR